MFQGNNEKGGETSNYYDTFHTPKNIELTFSDGSLQTFSLKNKPEKNQTVEFEPLSETTSLKLLFKDSYSGVGDGNDFFGVGRISFVGVEKVKEKIRKLEEEI